MDDNERKREIRRARWKALREAKASRFPGAVGRIPNFTGAEAAAARLATLDPWKRARRIHCNPDLAQRPVRFTALREGKVVVMAVPRLAADPPFLELDPKRLGEASLWHASSIAGAVELGRPLALPKRRPKARGSPPGRIDLLVVGAVAVSPDGARLGKGGGHVDLEYALLRETKVAGPRTSVVTTVHPTQVLRRGTIPMEKHDLSVDLYVTPTRVVKCDRTYRRPTQVFEELARLPE